MTVVYAGGISAAYGMDRLLDAAARLPAVRFLIFGKGDYVPRVTVGDLRTSSMAASSMPARSPCI